MELHPIKLLAHFSEQGVQAFEFSKYIYIPQSVSDDREYHQVPSLNSKQMVLILMDELHSRQELAIHSLVHLEHEKKYIPMLDLLSEFHEGMIDPIAKLMRGSGIRQFEIYRSGRSAHVYGLDLISASTQMHFFASALLLNLPNQNPIVDSRWIGHRLLAGYGSLRWSFNTKQYLDYPKCLGRFESQ